MPVPGDELRFLVRGIRGRPGRATPTSRSGRLQGDSTNLVSSRGDLGRLGEAQSALARDLVRHLNDEEDLVVPLILEQGERALFAHT